MWNQSFHYPHCKVIVRLPNLRSRSGQVSVQSTLVLEHDALFIIKINVTVQFVTCEVLLKKHVYMYQINN